jgi:hypothetical protein
MESWWSNNKGPLIEQGFALQDLQHALGVVGGSSGQPSCLAAVVWGGGRVDPQAAVNRQRYAVICFAWLPASCIACSFRWSCCAPG